MEARTREETRGKAKKKKNKNQENLRPRATAVRQAVWPFSRLLSPTRRGGERFAARAPIAGMAGGFAPAAVIRRKPAGICRALAFTAFTVAAKSPCATQLAVP